MSLSKSEVVLNPYEGINGVIFTTISFGLSLMSPAYLRWLSVCFIQNRLDVY